MLEHGEESHGTKEPTFCLTKAGNTIKNVVSGKLMKTATECNETSGITGLHSEGAEVEVRKICVEPLKRQCNILPRPNIGRCFPNIVLSLARIVQALADMVQRFPKPEQASPMPDSLSPGL